MKLGNFDLKKFFVAAATASFSFFFIVAPQPLQRGFHHLPVKMMMSNSRPASVPASQNVPIATATSSAATPPPIVGAWQDLAGMYSADVSYASIQTGISPKLLAAVIHVESRGQNIVSGAGAVGPMQLMPNTAWSILHVDPWKPRDNIVGGAIYLRRLLTIFHGHLRLALEAYNAGPTVVAQGNIPVPAQEYATRVIALAT